MPGIYNAAIIASLLSAGIIGGVILKKTPKSEWGFLLSAMVLILPMSYLMIYYVRVPFDAWFKTQIGTGELYKFLTNFYAPLTEEPAKIWPLLIPWFYKKVNKNNFVYAAAALGLGFGIGEMWMLANRIGIMPQYASLPWWQFSGFLGERFLVTFVHGGFVAVSLWGLVNHKFVRGLLGASGLHFALNFPIYLSVITGNLIPKPVWQIILSLWVVISIFIAGALYEYFAKGDFSLGRFLHGQAACPECGKIYNRPAFFAFNGLRKRYERCPYCKKWHWMQNKIIL